MDRMNPKVFFRNDDVRDTLDNSLIMLTDLFINKGVPISHSVEPGNVTNEVANWLNSIKNTHPDLIEITQHGYNHNLNNLSQKMEFGGNRSYQDQLSDITKGKEIMDRYFGDQWAPIFTFPYGTYNHSTLNAVGRSGYEAISSKIQFTLNARIKNLIGRTLRKDIILGKKISYHPEFHNNNGFKEISVSVNLIKKYNNQSQAGHYSFSEVKQQIEVAQKYTNIIGVLFHHRFHTEHLGLIENIIDYFISVGAQFSSITSILNKKIPD